MKIYLDSSVYGGYYDEAFMDDTRELFDYIYREGIPVITSAVVIKELAPARTEVRRVMRLLYHLEVVPVPEAAYPLAAQYVKQGILGRGSFTDALHIAIATLKGATTIVSWDIKHMIRRKNAFNFVNLRKGYSRVDIDTPSTILSDYDKQYY